MSIDFGGNLQSFQRKIDHFTKLEGTFSVTSTGASRKVFLPNGRSWKYFGREGKEDYLKGSFFIPMVRRQIDKYIELHGAPPLVGRCDVQKFNLKLISNSFGSEVCAIDLNSCYWYVIHKLGYIDDKLFQRGLDSGFKLALLVSIGCLNKLPQTIHYVNGKKASVEYDHDYQNRYSPFYWQIIRFTYDLMLETFAAIGEENWYMWLTDCVYFNPDVKDKIESIFNKHNLPYKSFEITFLSYDGKLIRWYDHKSDTKKMIAASNRDIQIAYNLNQLNNETK